MVNLFSHRKLPYAYPRGILTPVRGRYWHLTPVIIYLLSEITEVEKPLLQKTRILKRAFTLPVPWFRSTRGGGAIVLGTRKRPLIIFTENFFLREIYGRNARYYGNRLDVWLDMLSHEVGHVAQLDRIGAPAKYVLSFAWQYLRTMSHNRAPLEKEAETGRKRYRSFVHHIRNKGLMKEYYTLLRADSADEAKISQIRQWITEWKKASQTKNA
ncbi:hypothetical protein AB9P05_02610 [Roseivirga sp. BDSF3-8]|uniref:hypothetical protein n=1 Tax=Roseivirga sp. BDSF3-8 TaxID=3241598 RepID=UPI0035326780